MHIHSQKKTAHSNVCHNLSQISVERMCVTFYWVDWLSSMDTQVFKHSWLKWFSVHWIGCHLSPLSFKMQLNEVQWMENTPELAVLQPVKCCTSVSLLTNIRYRTSWAVMSECVGFWIYYETITMKLLCKFLDLLRKRLVRVSKW